MKPERTCGFCLTWPGVYAHMAKIYRIELDDFDLGQVIDGLEVHAEAWEKTAAYHRTGESPGGVLVEACRDAEEAETIAADYREIISKICEQRSKQDE